jgi:glycosyltransferase involved in cell wall biosynthesis
MSNYNYGHYIGQSIESILSQTWSNFELIICDDGSTDNSVATVQQYLKDSRVRLLQKENGGQASGFNATWGASRGDIICFLDADDFYLPEKLERIVECATLNPECGCVLNGFLRVDEKLRPQGSMPLLSSLPAGWLGDDVLRGGGVVENFPCTPGLNLRREIADVLFPVPVRPPLNRFPDMVIMRLAPLFSRVAAINMPLATVRLHGTNTYQRERVTARSIEREIDICRELWQEQRRRLEQIDSSLPELLTPLETAPAIIRQQYIWSRLSGSPGRWAYYRGLRASMRRSRTKLLQRVFWHATILLPRNIFDKVINIALTQNRFKQLILQMKKFISSLSPGIRTTRQIQIQQGKP